MSARPQGAVSQPHNAYGWLNSCLRWYSLLPFFTLELALLVTVIALTVVSHKKHGFVTIPTQNITSSSSSDQSSTNAEGFNVSWDLGVLWTSLPNFVFSLFGAYWAWIAGAIAERQPYVELRNESGADAKRSVLLDYRVTASIWRWWGAFRNKHYMVGATALLAVFLSYAVAPFAARLFVPQVVAVSKPLPVLYNEALNSDNINSTLDWRPVLDTVAASLLHHGNNLPWTDNEHAFLPYSTASRLATGTDMAANTTAYSAYLNCELIDDYTITSRPDSDAWTVQVSGTDRGCSFKQNFDVTDSQKIYFKTTVTLDCSSQACYSRFVFTSGTFSDSATNKLDDISVISCASGYQQVSGTLRVTPLTGPPVIRSFVETGDPDTGRPTLWRVFEQNILGPVSFNPQAEWSTTDMGSLILYYAEILSPSDSLGSSTLMEAIRSVFTAIYLNAIAIHGFDPLSEPETGTGTAFVPTTRLFVVPWVSYIVLPSLTITLCFVVFVFFRLRDNPSILAEEPEGLLSMAGILESSQLLSIASNIRQETDIQGGTREKGKSRPEVKDKKWTAEHDPTYNHWIIKSIDKPERGPAEHLLSPTPPSDHQRIYQQADHQHIYQEGDHKQVYQEQYHGYEYPAVNPDWQATQPTR